MEIKALSPFLSVTAQVQPSDIAGIAALGFKAIINNRPDKESDDQPLSAELAEEAARHDVAYCEIPVVAGQLNDANIYAFTEALEELHGPVLAFCRTGTRSATLWALSSARRLDTDARRIEPIGKCSFLNQGGDNAGCLLLEIMK